MELLPIIEHMRDYAPFFARRVGGAAQFKLISETTALVMPCAYVIPLEDSPQAPTSENAVRQTLAEGFAVVVCLNNAVDERGQAAAASVHEARRAVWKALLGWRPTQEHNGIYYDGGSLMQLDRAQLWFQFEFAAEMEIGPSDGWEEGMLAALPTLNTVHIQTDVTEPIFDKNLAPTGPDGRIEFESRVSDLNPP